MSCNAWNHPPDCSCGWGGAFHGIGFRDGADESWHWQRSENYTTPNASCPRCGVRVFFYRSPYGGSVYFDELGPPWPKHPCMDFGRTPSTQATRHPSVIAGIRPAPSAAREKGWRPLICDEIRRHQRCAEIVVMKVQDSSGSARTLYAMFNRTLLDHRTPFVARRKQDASFEVSTLNTQNSVPDELRFQAFSSPDGLPQPWRNYVKGIHVTQAAPVAAAMQPKTPHSQTPNPGTTKASRPDPSKVPISYRNRRPDSIKPKENPLVNREPIKPQLMTPTSPSSTRLQPSSVPSAAERRARSSDVPKPLTNMALAFQKLANSDPEVENLLITGFSGASKSS